MRKFVYRIFKVTETEKLNNGSYWNIERVSNGKTEYTRFFGNKQEDVMKFIDKMYF